MTLQTRFIAGAIVRGRYRGTLTAANSADANSIGAALASGDRPCRLLAADQRPFRPVGARPQQAAPPNPTHSSHPRQAPVRSPLTVPAGLRAIKPPSRRRNPKLVLRLATGSGAVIGLVGLVGLFVAASGSGFAYWGGLLIFVLAILLIFQLIGRAFDRAPHRIWLAGTRRLLSVAGSPAVAAGWLL